MIEKERKCGLRKVHALYLCGTGMSVPCDMLPLELKECTCCGFEIPFMRGFMWISKKYIENLANKHHEERNPNRIEKHLRECECEKKGYHCPLCNPWLIKEEKYGIMFVGREYTPESFIKEAMQMGVSKRIAQIPKDLILGKTWVLLAYKEYPFQDRIPETGMLSEPILKKAVFYAFIPQRFEYLIWKSEATSEYIKELEEQGLTPIIVPDGDEDHKQTGNIRWG